MKNQCDEIFALFRNVDELKSTRDDIIKTLFSRNTNKELFELFKEEHSCNYTKIESALSYSFYLCCLWLQNNTTNLFAEGDKENLFNQYSSNKQNEILFRDAFEMISIFYTCESLLKKNLFYQYSDFKDVFSTNLKYYETCFDKTTNVTFYRASKDAPTSKDQSNHTRSLRTDTSNSMFYEAMNYRTDTKNEKKVEAYCLNGFLPKLTLLLAEKSSRHTEITFNVQKDYNFPTPLRQLFDDFYSISAQIYDNEDVLSNILNFYKIELSFGFLTSITFIYNLENSPMKLDDALTALLNKHTFLNVYSPLRYSSCSLNTVPEDNKLFITTSKFIFALLYDLYEDNLEVLHKELGDCIVKFYSNNNPYNTFSLANSDFNCWHIMHYMFNIFKHNSAESRSMHFETLNTKYKQLSKPERQILFEHLKQRYSKKWMNKLKQLFQTKII